MDASDLNPEPPGRVYLLDAHGMVFQMFHGIPAMNAQDGRPTNAVFGVTRGIMNLYDRGAEYLIAIFDSPGKTFRDDIVSDYKAHRPPPPDDLITQEPMIAQVLEAMRIPRLSLSGYEADDIMATIAVEAVKRGHEVYLCTADKDCRQLLSDKVKIQNLRKDEILDKEFLLKDWGITPEQVIAYQALVGDTADNVEGVAGVGAKTAAKWLQQYGTLENLIANADSVGGPKVKASLKQAIADGALARSLQLVELKKDVPITFEWARWRRQDWDAPRLLELFQQFGFRGFANKVRDVMTKSGAAKNKSLLDAAGVTAAPTAVSKAPGRTGNAPVLPHPNKPSLFDQIDETDEFAFGANATEETPPRPPAWQSHAQLVATKADFDRFFQQLEKEKRFAFHCQTTGSNPMTAEIVGFSVCWKEGEAYYLPVAGPKAEAKLDRKAVLKSLKPLLEDTGVGKIDHNIKWDDTVLRSEGINLAGAVGDPMLAHYLLHAGARSHELDELSRLIFQHEKTSVESLTGKGKAQVSLADIAIDRVKALAGQDVDLAWRLCERLEPELEPAGLRPLYDDLEMPLVEVLSEMERNGFRIDTDFLGQLSQEMEDDLARMEAEIHQLAGREFNVNSPKQLREILFDELKLPVQKRTNTTGEPSTDQESLEQLASLGHELPRKIIEQRSIAKLKGTYVDALPELVNAQTGRVHTSFNQTVAATGRLSSSDPNLQNIPTRTDQGQKIRRAFIAAPGCQLLTADYSQIELRFLAHFCGDSQLQEAFSEDRDIHTRVAAEIFKVPEAEVTSAQRRAAKTVNFGVIYGISAYGLSVRLGMTRKEATRFIEEYFKRFPNVLEYQDRLLKNARQNGYVATILGRRRNFDPIAIRGHTTFQQRNQAEREAINMEIQGSAADLMKKAMLCVHRRMKAERVASKLLLSVHDELVFDVVEGEIPAMCRLVREEMIGAMKLSVPLKVDVCVGSNWLDAQEWSEI